MGKEDLEQDVEIIVNGTSDSMRKAGDKDIEIIVNGTRDSMRSSRLGDLEMRDHFTLSNPSSSLVFRNNDTQVFTLGTQQIVLEREVGSDVITAKQIDEGTPGLALIRGAYTLVAALMAGFLFVFCIQLILFLFLGLAIESGLTSAVSDFTFLVFFGTLFAIPAFLYAMANAMTIAMAFVLDTWNGQKFMKTILKWDSVFVDWISTTVFVFVPFLVAGVSLFMGSEQFWDFTLITWYVCRLLLVVLY